MPERINGSNAACVVSKGELNVTTDRAATVSPLSGKRLEAALARLGLLAIVVMVTAFSVLQSATRSLWYDEIFTVQVSGKGGPAAVWNVLQQGADGHPPFYFLVAGLGTRLVRNEQIGVRTPSTVATALTLCFVFIFLRKRVDAPSALAGVALVASSEVLRYGWEARPYALVVCFVAAAMCCWQRVNDGIRYRIGFPGAVLAATAMHYYAILVLPAFMLAELTYCVETRRFRASVWAGILCGFLPVLVGYELITHYRAIYGSHYWALPSVSMLVQANSGFYAMGRYWGAALELLLLALPAVGLYRWLCQRKLGAAPRPPYPYPAAECALVLGLIALPAIAYVMVKIAHGGLYPRYMLSAVLGGSVAAGWLCRLLPAAARPLISSAFLLVFLTQAAEDLRRNIPAITGKETAATPYAAYIDIAGREGLPLVFSSGLSYLPAHYYNQRHEHAGLLYYICDPELSLQWTQTDNVDLDLRAYDRMSRLSLPTYAEFVSGHSEFLVVSGDSYEWLVRQLLKDGHTLSLVSWPGSGPGAPSLTIHRVTLQRK